MRRGRWAEDPAALRAAAVDGVITIARLRRLGVPAATISRRCRGSGPWQRLLPGVVLLSTGTPTRRQSVQAALMYGGPHAVVTGLEACRRHGVRRGPAANNAVHLLVPAGRQLRTAGSVFVERTTRPPAAHRVAGVPLAPVTRACLDAARRLRSPREIAELFGDVVQRGMCTVPDLLAELAAGSQRGSATPRGVLADVSAGVRSAAERDARRLWRRTGLPEPWWNARVFDERGRLLAVVDAWFDDVALAWEIDSFAWHLSPADYARTSERAARLTSAGAIVLPTLPTRLQRDEHAVMGELAGAYDAAASRPRPALRARRANS